MKLSRDHYFIFFMGGERTIIFQAQQNIQILGFYLIMFIDSDNVLKM